MALLFIGDLHLGRRPAGLDDAFAEAGVDPRRLSPSAAWRTAVEVATDIQASAVVLAGDVVDSDRDRFEAYHALERGVADLIAAGIAVVGVAGNHDGLVLPRLAERIEGFHLLGSGGNWECIPLPVDGRAIDLLGWSFPDAIYRDDPLEHPSLNVALEGRRRGAALLGVIHGNLGQRVSRYAPLALGSLEASPADAWLLGHIHQPGDLAGPRPIGYLGSLVGLDPGEPGSHGAWRVEVDAGQVRATLLPLAPVRWENVDVPLDDGVADIDDVHARIQDTVTRALDDTTARDRRLVCVVVRARLTGRLRDRSAVREFVSRHRPETDLLQVDGRPCILESVADTTRPAIDLTALAGEKTPAGRVARRLLALEAGEGEDLVTRADEVVRKLTRGKFALAPGEPDLDVSALLRESAWHALDALLQHRSGREVS